MSFPITLTPQGEGWNVRLLDGSDGLLHSRGVFCPDCVTALACEAGCSTPSRAASVESPVLTAMKERLGQPTVSAHHEEDEARDE